MDISILECFNMPTLYLLIRQEKITIEFQRIMYLNKKMAKVDVGNTGTHKQ